MIRAAHGSIVTVSCIGTLDNGRIFHSTETEGTLTVTIGAGEVFPALERALIGMAAGEVKNVVLTAEEAYGARLKENLLTVSRKMFPAERVPAAGQQVDISFRGGESRAMVIVAVSDDQVTLDGNHPLAGCDLTFALRIDRVEQPEK